MLIRNYHPSDCKEIAELFYNTVHIVKCKRLYKRTIKCMGNTVRWI